MLERHLQTRYDQTHLSIRCSFRLFPVPDAACGRTCRQYRCGFGQLWGTLLTLSVATSLDALAVGFSFAMAKFPILWPSVVIGSVCFVLTAIAVMLGSKLSSRAARHSAKLSLFGAAVLFAIGLKVLYEHDVFQGLF